MFDTVEHNLPCPYCGETITLLIDGSVNRQSYVEDCSVCCSPILVEVVVTDDDDVFVQARQENN